jgi:poly(A) polymerase Pap1
MFYLRRSIPDLAQFRLAYLLIKTWAKERGIFSAKFGYLGGIHLSTMLVLVCKMLSHDSGLVSVPDIIVTFFAHYAKFDWKTKMVFDPFFHKKLRYTRTFREPLCLLGWHAPILNTAHTASAPTVKALASELRKADELLAQPGTTWQAFLGCSSSDDAQPGRGPRVSGAASFLKEYRSYIKVDVHYWGPSQEKGNQYVGWLESRCVLLLVGRCLAD